jgi:cysteine desulfurase
VEPSYVLAACGVSKEWAQGALRFTVGRGTTDDDIDAVCNELPKIVERVRSFKREKSSSRR